MTYGVLQLDVGFDLADLGGLELDVVENGGNTFTTTLSTGKHFLRTDASAASGAFASKVTAYTSLIAAVVADFNAQGDPAGTWTASFDTTTKRVSFSHDGGGSVVGGLITPVTNGGLVGFSGAVGAAAGSGFTITGGRTPDHYLDSDIGFWASWDEYEAETDALVDVEAHDGTPHSIAPEGVAEYIDFVVPNEPRAKVLTRFAETSDPYTWRDGFQHARNVEPWAVYDGEETHLVRLRREGARWRPRKVAGDYVGHYDVPMLTRLLGRL